MTLPARQLLRENTIFFLCDVQSKFRTVSYGFEDVCVTANKMFKSAKLLDIPVVATEQTPEKLGETVSEIDIASLGPLHLGTFKKTQFSMVIPEVVDILYQRPNIRSIVLFGIEANVCVLQTALDLLDRNYTVHVVADGVSSGSKLEIPYALASIRATGGNIGTSTSILFQLMRDSSHPNFRAFAKLIKDETENTNRARAVFLQDSSPTKSSL